jgi:hypothetical protein
MPISIMKVFASSRFPLNGHGRRHVYSVEKEYLLAAVRFDTFFGDGQAKGGLAIYPRQQGWGSAHRSSRKRNQSLTALRKRQTEF